MGSTVFLLGACSLLTDISSEMVAAVLPLYLVSTLGFAPLQVGIVDGIYQGASALVRLASGFMGDKMGRHKPLAAVGYALSSACKLALAVIGGAWAGLSAVILLDRIGKGIRTAPRDAMISLSVPKKDLGLAFGVHRAMDTAGAMLGPLLAFALLAAAPGSFQPLFLLSFIISLLGVGVIVLLVREPRVREQAEDAAKTPDLRSTGSILLRMRDFRALTTSASLLGVATVSDGFIYLILHDRLDFDARYFPLLATGTALVYMLLATPMGRLSDRVGRGKVLVAGYVTLLAAYGLLLSPSGGMPALVGVLVLVGVYYAATDGVIAAMAGATVPPELRGSGLALVGTANGVARLLASVIFGATWSWLGVETAIAVFAVLLLVAIFLAARTLRLNVA